MDNYDYHYNHNKENLILASVGGTYESRQDSAAEVGARRLLGVGYILEAALSIILVIILLFATFISALMMMKK